MKLWQNKTNLNKTVEIFETKDDLVLDNQIAIFDVAATIAHGKMLAKMGILSKQEFESAHNGLLAIAQLIKEQKFNLEMGDEDIHTKIENYLTQHVGEVGKKIHTGRSRNDQVLTALRLLEKQKIFEIWQQAILLTELFLEFAEKYKTIPMPGYTHMQKAMPYSVGAWAVSFVSGLLDSLEVLEKSLEVIDQSPLGSAAGFGAPLKIDKNYTAKLLGFKNVQINSLSCQNSRGKLEAIILADCIALLTDVNKFASDILFFTTNECNFFTVDATVTTGSSIMPQKKNVDLAELLRSKIHVVLGNYLTCATLSTNVISGFNRDLQDSKKPVIEGLQTTIDSLAATQILLSSITPKEKELTKAITPEMLAAHKAVELTQKGVAFRDAYHQVATHLQEIKPKKAKFYLKHNTNLGDTGNLQIHNFKEKLNIVKQILEQKSSYFETSLENLLQKGGE